MTFSMRISNEYFFALHRCFYCYTPVWGAFGAVPDSIDLKEVVVVGRSVKQDVIPVQTLSGDELQRLNSNSVADALRYFRRRAGEGLWRGRGIKTVNIRSMGTNHTGVVYDGVALGNAQNGQIDLGQFSLDNMEALSLHNGQKVRFCNRRAILAMPGRFICVRAGRSLPKASNFTLAGRCGSVRSI